MTESIDDLEERACSGDPEAFGLLARRYDRDLRGTVWSVVQSTQEAEDVMQTAYERAFRSIGAFNRESSLKTWLHSICYRTAIDHLRYESRRRHPPIDKLASQADVLATDETAFDRMEVTQALARLDPDQRAVLMLTAGLGYSFDEAAAITGLRRGTVASKAARARRKLTRWKPGSPADG